ncbi:hypothetical protein Mgra_00007086 [Meloidogyne graminicola]|uniref:ShKT domain-containing protein n=1 Tax=Meloidogyne graminicola TaxID=189291 RepID=A0A8S9ZJZ0_9BILA|nr:hypothetical protein Mgra_00007086 [Meloidogyne graminicola]
MIYNLFKILFNLFLLFLPFVKAKTCLDMMRMGFCDNVIYKDIMQKKCMAECGQNYCFDVRADLWKFDKMTILLKFLKTGNFGRCPYWKSQPENFCNNGFYSPQTVELWCKQSCNFCTPATTPENARKK